MSEAGSLLLEMHSDITLPSCSSLAVHRLGSFFSLMQQLDQSILGPLSCGPAHGIFLVPSSHGKMASVQPYLEGMNTFNLQLMEEKNILFLYAFKVPLPLCLQSISL